MPLAAARKSSWRQQPRNPRGKGGAISGTGS
jgi:hypothetical protein